MPETNSRYKFINGVLCIEDPREQERMCEEFAVRYLNPPKKDNSAEYSRELALSLEACIIKQKDKIDRLREEIRELRARNKTQEENIIQLQKRLEEQHLDDWGKRIGDVVKLAARVGQLRNDIKAAWDKFDVVK